jgi:hypothetical protein
MNFGQSVPIRDKEKTAKSRAPEASGTSEILQAVTSEFTETKSNEWTVIVPFRIRASFASPQPKSPILD